MFSCCSLPFFPVLSPSQDGVFSPLDLPFVVCGADVDRCVHFLVAFYMFYRRRTCYRPTTRSKFAIYYRYSFVCENHLSFVRSCHRGTIVDISYAQSAIKLPTVPRPARLHGNVQS